MIKKLAGIVMSAALVLSVSAPAFASEIQIQPRTGVSESVQVVIDAIVDGVAAGYNLGMLASMTPADMAR